MKVQNVADANIPAPQPLRVVSAQMGLSSRTAASFSSAQGDQVFQVIREGIMHQR